MSNWKEILLSPDTPILESLRHIDSGSLQIVFVVDEQGRLLGSVSDGDVRRGILRGIALSEPVHKVMNTEPVSARPGEDRQKLLEQMKRLTLRVIPLLDEQRRVAGLETLNHLLDFGPRANLVVVMAGGLGTRLKPLTNVCPKPMLTVGGRPILEIILETLVEAGFKRFCFAVNYMAEMIHAHFDNGSRWKVDIQYLHEEQPLGTAGALGLLSEPPEDTFLVMNGDVLTKVDFGRFIDFHRNHQAMGTMCVRKYDFQVPYGVVMTDGHEFLDIEEKPVHNFFVNAGIYALEPTALRFIPKSQRYDMTEWFRDMQAARENLAVYPVREYWMDIGQNNDLQTANEDFPHRIKP
jgi:dTDP-glucose pyrophosphorylase